MFMLKKRLGVFLPLTLGEPQGNRKIPVALRSCCISGQLVPACKDGLLYAGGLAV